MKAKKPAPRRLTLRQQLKVIEGFLMDPKTGGQLADVLSALRGPDNGSSSAKDESTAFIRRNAFPILGRNVDRKHNAVDATDKWIMAEKTTPTEPIDLDSIHNQTSYHFADHIRRAALLLGIAVESPRGVFPEYKLRKA